MYTSTKNLIIRLGLAAALFFHISAVADPVEEIIKAMTGKPNTWGTEIIPSELRQEVNKRLRETWASECAECVGRRDSVSSDNQLDQIMLVTHQIPVWQERTSFLIQGLKPSATIVLASQYFQLTDLSLTKSADLLQASSSGEIQLPLNAREFLLAGGFADLCFKNTLQDASAAALAINAAVKLTVFSDYVYYEHEPVSNTYYPLSFAIAHHLPESLRNQLHLSTAILSGRQTVDLDEIQTSWLTMPKQGVVEIVDKGRMVTLKVKAKSATGKPVEVDYVLCDQGSCVK